MATIELQGTQFTMTILPKQQKNPFWIRTEIAICNAYVSYKEIGESITLSEWETFLTSASRLLAGGYEKEYSIAFEKAGLAVDLYAYTENGMAVPRAIRREKDCVMAIRLLLRSKDKEHFLGGVYSLLLHRAEIESFLDSLRTEFAENVLQRIHGRGKYAFVGVSPLGYKGCNYLYLDPTKKVKAGEYVWVRMGRHNTEQIVYVDSVKRYEEEEVPYNPKNVKQVLRKATKEEVKRNIPE